MAEKTYYVVCWQRCDHCDKAPNDGLAVRIDEAAVDAIGKYVRMKCPSCGETNEFKRGGWWNFNELDEVIEDSDYKDKLISSLPDYTELVR